MRLALRGFIIAGFQSDSITPDTRILLSKKVRSPVRNGTNVFIMLGCKPSGLAGLWTEKRSKSTKSIAVVPSLA